MKSPTYLIQKNKLLTDNIGIAEEVYSLNEVCGRFLFLLKIAPN